MAKVKLYYLDDNGSKRRISVEPINYEVQEIDNDTCLMINQRNGLVYKVKDSFDRLHYLVSGFGETLLN